MGLVAGHVTGGGGKATTKKPNGIERENAANCESLLDADRRRDPRRYASEYKIAVLVCACSNRKPLN